MQRITTMLDRLPQAIHQAHERIIGERQVKNTDKMLSLYEEHAAVYVRGKAGAEVEFGSQLLLGEAVSGVIVDWELVDGNPRADTKMLGRSLERMKPMTAGAVSAAEGLHRAGRFEGAPVAGVLAGGCGGRHALRGGSGGTPPSW